MTERMMVLGLTDSELEAMVKQHKGTIHTKEYPTRCGMCRLFDRLEAAEACLLDVWPSSIDDKKLKAWRKAASAGGVCAFVILLCQAHAGAKKG